MVRMNESFASTQIILTQSRADPTLKHLLWTQITDCQNKDLQGAYTAKCMAFMQMVTQRDLVEPYFDLFYEVLPAVASSLPRSKVLKFARSCCPAARGSQKDL